MPKEKQFLKGLERGDLASASPAERCLAGPKVLSLWMAVGITTMLLLTLSPRNAHAVPSTALIFDNQGAVEWYVSDHFEGHHIVDAVTDEEARERLRALGGNFNVEAFTNTVTTYDRLGEAIANPAQPCTQDALDALPAVTPEHECVLAAVNKSATNRTNQGQNPEIVVNDHGNIQVLGQWRRRDHMYYDEGAGRPIWHNNGTRRTIMLYHVEGNNVP